MYEAPTPEAIKRDILDRLNGAWDTREMSFADDMVGAAALKLAEVLASLGELPAMIWPDATSGPYLDREAQDLGIAPRKAGTKATVLLHLAGTPDYQIPAGKAFATLDGLLFDTLDAAVLSPDGEAAVRAAAREPGERYNAPAGKIVYQFSNDANLTTVTNPAAAAGGTDAESDAALFAREDAARKKPRTSGNANDYEGWALEVGGVSAARCYPVYYGRGTVMVLVGSEGWLPVDADVLRRCQEHIEALMPCGGIELTILTPQPVAVNLAALVTLDGTATLEDVKERCRATAQAYFAELSRLEEKTVVYTRMGALLSATEGVADYHGLTLNGQTDNIALGATQVPSIGEVLLT